MRQDSLDSGVSSRFFLDQGIDGVLIHDEAGNILDVNEVVCRILLYSRSELLSLRFQDIHAGAENLGPSQMVCDGPSLLPETVPRETVCRRKDGSLLPVEIKCRKATHADAKVFVSVVRDISDRKKREDVLHEAVNDWRTAFDVIPDSIFTIDSGRLIKRCNKATLQLLGKLAPDVVGQKCHAVISGSSKPHDNCPFERLQKSGKRESSELLLGDRWFECITEPINDGKGNLQSVVHVLRDISDRKRIEDERLILSKLESTGVLAGGLAHDFNNLLAVIIGNIEIAKELAQDHPKIMPFLKSAEKAVWGARDLTNRLITFARGGVSIIKPTGLDELLRKSTAEALKGSKVKCEVSDLDDLPPVAMDEHQMLHVFRNILQNSREALEDNGIIKVTASVVNVSSLQKIPVNPGMYVCIEISDKGKGIPPEILGRIFDPYFSTKERGIQKGMGLGLTICHSIINKHSGTVTVDSQVGVGTTFRVYLPVSSVAQIEEIAGQRECAGPDTRILAMDDEEAIREILRNAVDTLGFKIEVAEDGSQALEMYAQALRENKPFNLVLLDLTVPGKMGGKEALEEIRKIDPKVMAIVSSGYAKDPVMINYAQFGFRDALVKPYRLQHLKDTLEKFLSKKS